MSGPAFAYIRASSIDDALQRGAQPGAAFLAGGTDFMQLWKAGIQTPRDVVDISRLPFDRVDIVDGALALGALARLGDVAAHPDVQQHHPLIAQAILASASGQIRNMATVGGNLLQRTRCPYFRGKDFPCNKRIHESGCGARTGENRQHAVFGASEACVAVHPSDLAVALVALNAEVEISGPTGRRRLALADLYKLPGEAPMRETDLRPGEIITQVRVPIGADVLRSGYLKIRDRASFEFALISVAAALRLQDGAIVEARLAAGGVAPMPWRLPRCEAALIGRAPTVEVFASAAALAVEGAQPLAHNGFKIELLRRAVLRALESVGGQP
jgi:xanthine dehydrogenase YagS FAD-binding subunit